MYHITASGEPGICRAKIKCPLGGGAMDHFESPESARAAYESIMFVETELKVTPYSDNSSSTRMHTDITEGGAQTIAVLNCIGVYTDSIETTDDLASAIHRLPKTVDGLENLQKLSGALKALTDKQKAIGNKKIAVSKLIASTVVDILHSQGFTDEEISKDLRWVATEDNKGTAADLAFRDINFSIKAGSPTLGNTTDTEGSRRIGMPEGESVFKNPKYAEVEERVLSVVNEDLKKTLNGYEVGATHTQKVLNVDRTWTVKENDGVKVIEYTKGSKKFSIPVSALEDLNELKTLTSSQQKIIASYITGNMDRLKEETEYNNLVEERAAVGREIMAESFNKLDSVGKKTAIAKFSSLKPGHSCFYVSVSGKKVDTGRIPSMEEFLSNSEVTVDSALPRGEGILVLMKNENTKEYSAVQLRARYRDGQFVYPQASIVGEYPKTEPSSNAGLASEGYSFKTAVEMIFN
jgi:hypothetical protein